MKMTMAERYVRLRYRGHRSAVAARKAGYSSGPSGHAKKLWRNLQLMRSRPNARQWLTRAENDLHVQLADVRDKLVALDLLESLSAEKGPS